MKSHQLKTRKDTPLHDRVLSAFQQIERNSRAPLSLKLLLRQNYLP